MHPAHPAKTSLPAALSSPHEAPIAPTKHGVGVHLRYAFEHGEQRGAELGNPLFELLAAVIEGGSIRHAAQTLGTSYRYVWGSLRKWEKVLGEPLISWSQGQKARPTQFAERLLWAERSGPHACSRISRRSDLIWSRAGGCPRRTLSVAHGTRGHDLALLLLSPLKAAESVNLHLELGFQGSVEAVRALNDRQCLVAGFHVPALRGAAPVFARALKPLLKPKSHKLIACSRRTQGLMVRKEHAALVRTFPDVLHRRLRFVNRQPGSGTRLLVDHLMHEHSIAPGSISGALEHVEHTHVAVALCIASGVVDAGVRVEAAALQFGLHFIPLVEENYFLACLSCNVGHPAIQRLRGVLAGARWRQILAHLPGYQPAVRAGDLLVIEEALPWWHRARSAAPP